MNIRLAVNQKDLLPLTDKCLAKRDAYLQQQPAIAALKAISKAIKRIQERLGIPQWTAHDLRRSFGTQLGESLQIDPVVIEKCLGHKMPKMMATYNKDEMLNQRKEALEQWSRTISELIFLPPLHNVFQEKKPEFCEA